MCHGELDFDRVGERHVIDFRSYFAEAVQRLGALADDGLVEVSAAGMRATSRGKLLLRIIAMCFDRYLPAPGTATTQFSRTV
jgi:oxygen-independent coproporphyrinogen-3 oxidase